MNISEFLNKFDSMINEELTNVELWKRAEKGDRSILSDPRVSKIKDGRRDSTPLHWLALNGVKEVLDHPDAGKVKNEYGETPIHHLASKGVKEVLSYPDVGKIKNMWGETPLHFLARRGVKEVLEHPDSTKVKDNKGRTPKDLFVVISLAITKL